MDGSTNARAVAQSLQALLERHGVHSADEEGDMYYHLNVLKANNWVRTDAVNAFLGEAMRRAESA
jgi:hypothetical protein